MFFVRDPSLLGVCIFTHGDPRRDGYTGPLEEGVTLEYDMSGVSVWRDGERRPCQALGVSTSDPRAYRVFKYEDEVAQAGYRHVASGCPFVFGSWADYCRMRDQIRAGAEPSAAADRRGMSAFPDS